MMDNVRQHRKILRSPSVKRKNKVLPVNQRVQLQRVLGVTVSSNAGLSCDSNNGTIAYPAGCVVVLFNPRRNKQSHIFNTTKKTITALAFSRDGKHLITGETGHQPAVRVWDVAEKTQVAEFRGHKFGINCVAFSPNMKEVVSVGTQHDMMINVWNWKTGNKVACNNVSSKVSAIAFSEDGKCFVTVGNRHVRFWYLEERRSKINQTVPLMGRSGILGDQKNNFFCDVVAGQGPMCGRFFVITQSGLLCEFNEKRQLDKWVELRTKSANCITAGQEHIFVGCAEGVVRVFSSTSLHYLCSLPKPHHLGVEVTTATSPSHMVAHSQDAKYPDTKAIAIDDDHKKVTCIYNDRSVYIWDVHDIKRVGKAWSFLYHSGCIWSLEVYPQLEEGTKSCLPPGSFLTASGDNTIRVWNLNTHMPENTAYKRNIYSNELLKIVYADPTLTSLCNVDYNPAGATDKTDTTYDGKNGVRSIRVSPDGADLASGDRQGNIRIYDMDYLNEKKSVEAHEADVMCLEYSYTQHGKFLATSSRDRLIHVFDVDQNYGLVQTLGDHSSSITAVRFTDTDDKLRMISCGADKSILLRNAVTSPDFQFQLEHHLATKITLYDMVIDPTQKCLATACQDRNVRLYNIQTTKEKKCYKGSAGDEGVLLRIHLDPSGTYAATTCTDKNVCILDFNTGELMATMYGHSEVITGVKFANDLKHVITVSADGCIFVWRLPSEMTNQIKGRLLELGKHMKDTDYFRSDQPLMPNPVMLENTISEGNFHVVKSASVSHIPMQDTESVDGREDDDDKEVFDDTASHASLDYRFSIGQLPNWAKAKFGDSHTDGLENNQEQLQPKGRWAQRVDHNIEFKSQLDLTSDEDTISTYTASRRQELAGELSVGHLSDIRRETVVLGRTVKSKNVPVIGDDFRGSPGDLHLPASARELREMEKMNRHSFAQYKSDTALNITARRSMDPYDLLHGNSLELDDTDEQDTGSDTTEVIYPPTDQDSDLFASTYQIFAADDKKIQGSGSGIGNTSSHDDASESTDPVSVDDDDDHNDETLALSNPTTPSDPDKEFLARTPDKEDFVRENFEEDTFSPMPLEKFNKSVDNLEIHHSMDGTVISVAESTPFSPRLSLSARFMSRAQTPHKILSSGQIGYRPDNWFSRNKLEMSRAMDETRKSLLAARHSILAVHMSLHRNSLDSDSPDKEDPPSPPTKLEDEEAKFPALDGGPMTSSPITGDFENRIKNSPKDPFPLTKSSLASSSSPIRPAVSSVTSPVARRINQERERRKSCGKSQEPQDNKTADSTNGTSTDTSQRPTTSRIRPTYFKPTQSSKNKVNRVSDGGMESTLASKVTDLGKKPIRSRSKLAGSKLAMYASTPNLILGAEDDDVETEEKPQKPAAIFSSNLRLSADLSRSVPDVNDADSSTDSSSTGSSTKSSRRSEPLQSKFISRFSAAAALNDQKLMPPPSSIPSTSRFNGSSSQTAGTYLLRKDSGEIQPRRKLSASEMTLDQAKNILLGKSGVLNKAPETAPIPIVPSRAMRDSRASSISSVSTLMSSGSPPLFDSDLAHASPSQLAVAEEIEYTANMLRHQKQASSHFSPERLSSHAPSNLEASPLDLPERDQPSPNTRRTSPKPQPPVQSSQCPNFSLSASQPIQSGSLSRTTANNTFTISTDVKSKDFTSVDKSKESGDDETPGSIRDRIARFQTQNMDPVVSGSSPRSSSPYRRTLPASPIVAPSQGEDQDSPPPDHSDTGQGSDSSDNSHINTATYTIGNKLIAVQNSHQETSRPDRSKLGLPLPTSPSSQVFVNHCQSVLNEFHSDLSKVKELFYQVEGKTDENSQQVLAMLGQTFHEAHQLLTELAAKTQRSASPSLHSSLQLSQDSQAKTFHSSGLKNSDTETVVSTSASLVNSSVGQSHDDQLAILSATKDMLQPFVSQLSHDLSRGIIKYIKEKVDESENPSIV
ncbi:WD repeat-containing protein 62-like [Physella acuta]|uniref:WD repeat-containing protein 62-like n=1 Tax=Physella acuta TaxID=109671 RepID=UPI0027DD3B69|nr:WD repeat-containing protein 62-like [Physella acuta]